MMKKAIVSILICMPLIVFCQKVKTIRLFNNKVEILLPEEFKIMSEPADTTSFVFEDKPYTVRFSVLTSDKIVDDNNIPAYTNEVIETEKKRRFPPKIYDDGVSLNKGKNISYIKYGFENEHSPLFEYIFYGSLNDKLITFYFECVLADRAKWEKKIDAIVSTLQIKDKIID